MKLRGRGSRQGWRRAVVAVVERAVAASVERTVGMYAGEAQARWDISNPSSERVQVQCKSTTTSMTFSPHNVTACLLD